jgi:hypothetical protein
MTTQLTNMTVKQWLKLTKTPLKLDAQCRLFFDTQIDSDFQSFPIKIPMGRHRSHGEGNVNIQKSGMLRVRAHVVQNQMFDPPIALSVGTWNSSATPGHVCPLRSSRTWVRPCRACSGQSWSSTSCLVMQMLTDHRPDHVSSLYQLHQVGMMIVLTRWHSLQHSEHVWHIYLFVWLTHDGCSCLKFTSV